MADILATRYRTTVSDFASSSVLIGFDYDGTLAPIASTPARARMRARTRRLLNAVARAYPCVVISGRPYEDLVDRLRGVPLRQMFGNHGLEPWAASPWIASRAHEWARHLRTRLAGYPGLVVEDKRYSVSVHYRRVRHKTVARRAIAQAVRELTDARAVPGRAVVNLLRRGGPDKGVALQRARRLLACETAIYVGDDATDEDVFVSAPGSQLLGIRVGAAPSSRARYRLRRQSDVDHLLQLLLELRSGRSAAVVRRCPR